MSSSDSTPRIHAHFPSVDVPTSARWIGAVTDAKGRLWGAVRTEREGRSRLTLLASAAEHEVMRNIDLPVTASHPHRPALAAAGSDRISVTWNECGSNAWAVNHALAGAGGTLAEPERVWQSPSLCLPPACHVVGETTWAAWSARDGASFRIMLAQRSAAGEWCAPLMVSDGVGRAFRPALASNGRGLLVVWDQYREGRYEIAYTKVTTAGDVGQATILSAEGRHWLSPVVVAVGREYVLAWLDVRDVMDRECGIVDHWVGVMTARLSGGSLSYLPATEDDGPALAADLRPGLLATEYYRGYDGLRRRPQLSVDGSGVVWVCWEARQEGGGKQAGQLLAKRLRDGGWDQEVLLHDKGLCYAVPPAFPGPEIPFIFIPQDAPGQLAFHCAAIDPKPAPATETNIECWARWAPACVAVESETPRTLNVSGEDLTLYWADLHCHSVQSPDAEGEPDELILHGRDRAGLDAMAIVDNDYYPNKAFAEAEWRQQEELVRAFTQPGRFVLFPAYEYTYHNPDLEPDFNHRYVLYRRPPGRLVRRIDAAGCTIDGLEAALEGEDALLVAHHCTWNLSGRPPTNVEVCSSWRVCIEETDFVGRRLAAGDRFGFMACSDSHRACPGLGGALTGVYAKELTPDAIFEALRHRRTVATQGQRVLIDLRVNEAFIGEECCADSGPQIRLKVAAPEPIEFVEIIRDGQAILRMEPAQPEADAEFADRSAGAGSHCYYVRVKMEGDPSFNAPDHPPDFYRPFIIEGRYASNLARAHGPFAWSSPIWMTVE